MPIRVSDHLLPFAVEMACAARLLTAQQLARHPELSWRTQPAKRASQWLHAHPGWFERCPGPVADVPHRWRLTRAARRRLKVTWSPVPGMSTKADHWLALGDVWLALAFAGGRPAEWRAEPDGQFDAYCVWSGVPLLIELQRTPITTRQWRRKWEQRVQWYRRQTWTRYPQVVLVDLTGQTAETVGLPRGAIRVTSIEALPRALAKLR